MDFLLPENGHIDPDDGDYMSKDLTADRMVQHEPLLICNYELEDLSNERQFDRIFSDHKFENVLDPRFCKVGSCTQDLRKEKFCKEQDNEDFGRARDASNLVGEEGQKVDLSNFSGMNPFTSGKSDPRFYFKAIDTESRLQRIGYADNLCYVKDFRSQEVPEGGDKEVFDKDFRTPIRLGGRLECGDLEIPDQCDKTKLYYYPQDFMRDDQYKSTMFYTNTRRKTQNDW